MENIKRKLEPTAKKALRTGDSKNCKTMNCQEKMWRRCAASTVASKNACALKMSTENLSGQTHHCCKRTSLMADDCCRVPMLIYSDSHCYHILVVPL